MTDNLNKIIDAALNNNINLSLDLLVSITDRETTSNDLIDLLCMYINTSKKFEKKEDVKALCELGRKVEILTKKINYIQQKYKESVTSNIRTSEELAKVKQKETDKTCKIIELTQKIKNLQRVIQIENLCVGKRI